MLNRILVLLLWCIVVHQSHSQELKLSAGVGGSTSNQKYIYASPIGPFTEQGQYVLATNISYPFIGNGFGLCVESFHRIYNEQGVSFNSSSIVAGLCWRKLLSFAEIETFCGVGNSWDKYKLNDVRTNSYSISNNMVIYHGGATLYIPTSEFMDIAVGARITKNNSSHAAASFPINDKDLHVPSILYSGMIGLSFNLFVRDS